MNLGKKSLFLGGFIALITLAGCARYKANPLKKLVTPPAKTTSQTIAFSHHELSKGECKLYLDRDVIAKGYQPVHIAFTNNSKNYFTLSKKTSVCHVQILMMWPTPRIQILSAAL